MKEESKVGIILQARMGSSRLPGKVLLPFGETTLLGWIVNRLNKLPWKLVVATTILNQDKVIVDYCKQSKVYSYIGSEKDVLDRYYKCATEHAFDHVVRLTADNPFTDIQELTNLVRFHIDEGNDYSHNFTKLPIGVGAEIFTMNTLAYSWKHGQELHHKEHVNEYILEQPGCFKIGHLQPLARRQLPELALTIDTQADYQRISALVARIKHTPITTEELIRKCTSSV